MGVFKKLGQGIADLSELQVQTMTGTITTEFQSDNAESVLDWQKLIQGAKTDSEGKITLIAATNVKFDGDTDLFISDSATPALLQAHADAVEGARKVREGLVEAFSDLLGVGTAGG